jgi:tetratricopeptide (TPR) repeat protein
MKTVRARIVRGLLAVLCVFLTARTARIAVADLRAQRNGMQGLESAIRLEPADSVLLVRAALYRSENGDASPDADRLLRHASEEDPLNADVLMALGLGEEFQGRLAGSERYLVHAAAIDHTFKPAWTLANFYFRNNQPDKSWPMIQRIMNLDPLAVDPSPVFDLCWYETGDSKRIQALVPAHAGIRLGYLLYLMNTKRIDAVMDFWPRVLEVADPANPSFAGVMIAVVESLERSNRVPDAVRAWNQLVERGIVDSGRLDPAAGVSVADPDFSFPLFERGFGWALAPAPGVTSAKEFSSLRLEFDGNEPESSLLLTTAAPLLPGRAYRLVWKTDASRLSAPRDPGFAWRIVQQPGNVVTECQPLLKAGDEGACRFTSLPGAGNAQLNLMYTRALGTTRVEGMLRITNVKLEFGP